uniref:Helicase C-terminal domain-containing protein n=1 Tax=Meloidogyne floridensis TaxID=298350 RepID=A0A915PB74_9BILA
LPSLPQRNLHRLIEIKEWRDFTKKQFKVVSVFLKETFYDDFATHVGVDKSVEILTALRTFLKGPDLERRLLELLKDVADHSKSPSCPNFSSKFSSNSKCFLQKIIYTATTKQICLAKKRSGFANRFAKIDVLALDEVVQPQKVPLEKHVNIELEGVQSSLSRQVISSILDRFARDVNIRDLAATQNITKNIFQKAFQSFRMSCCLGQTSLDPRLQVIFSDIIKYDHSVDQIYPYFLRHAHKVFPHLERFNELRIISDLTHPHNCGKTYEALEEFKKAKSGMYCGPLRLLAFEIYERINKDGIPCDMVTGEQRLFAHDSETPAAHCTYTAEMVPIDDRRDICVIDEIQMLRDVDRGTAWTRALLGVAADEAAIDLVLKLLDPIGEHVDVRKYERKGELVVIDTHGLRDLSAVQDGDCIIHFNKQSILKTARTLLHEYGKESAIIFGDLPPETKREQIENMILGTSKNPCKILLATDAIGMGINLNIKRVIFTTLMKDGQIFPTFFVKQIAGRAGRFASRYCKGEVMTLLDEDSRLLGRLMNEPIQPIAQAGISPSFEAIELFSLHLPHCSLSQLLDIFASISSVSEDYFSCSHARIREMAILIEHIPLSLRDRYTFCLCPVNNNGTSFLSTAYIMIVKKYSEGNAITIQFIKHLVMGEMRLADNLDRLRILGDVYDILYAYLWLSYRFEDYFPNRDLVRELQVECGDLINKSIQLMILKESSKKSSAAIIRKSPYNEKIKEKRNNIILKKDGKTGGKQQQQFAAKDFENNFRFNMGEYEEIQLQELEALE